MALVKCPECGKDISDLAEICPNCGYPIKVEVEKEPMKEEKTLVNQMFEDKNNINSQKKKNKRTLFIIIGIFAIFCFVAFTYVPSSRVTYSSDIVIVGMILFIKRFINPNYSQLQIVYENAPYKVYFQVDAP